ncbi:MAG: histidine kinase dimerization/phosphoacceptor domain -containing protein [Paracoccaceae bacterium]
MKAEFHPRQSDRLKALYSYEILDTDREKEFDDVVALAAGLCGTAVSVINLIDAERQWFKAEVGLGARETPLETSLCSHVILENDFVEIPDTLLDPRMVDNPMCCGDPGLRFYAGALLRSDDGLPIGTLCVLDYEPKVLTPLQRDAVRVLADQVMNQLDLRRALKTAEVLRNEVHHRVKNSLQSVSSLTAIQSRGLSSNEARYALATVQQRIETVAALHEQLYKTNAGDRIDLGDFIANVVHFMDGTRPRNVTLKTDIADLVVDSSRAAAIGVLVNEFATNAFKHAFPDGRDGVVLIVLETIGPDLARLSCSDDGVGLSDEARATAKGFGLKILEASALQIGGRFEIAASGSGTKLSLLIPLSS